jgi:hypothetical protein
MPLPFAVAAFCITVVACPDKRKSAKRDVFVSGPGRELFVQDAPHSFTVGAIDMSRFIQSSIETLPSVKGVSVKTTNNRVQIEVTVDAFDWKNLEPIYQKELDLSEIFQGHPLDFRVIDESHNAGAAVQAI